MTSTLIVYSQKLTDVEYIYRRVNNLQEEPFV